MTQATAAPFGSWPSPITARLIAGGTLRLGQMAIEEEDVYWIERRPSEAGRSVIVRAPASGEPLDVTPAGLDVGSRVHEYGGGDMVVAEGTVYFANSADLRLYRQAGGQAPEPLTPATDLRYADGVIDRLRQRMICVREDHTAAGAEPSNTLVALDLNAGGAGDVLVQGHDFYASPRLSPNGSQLAWLSWNHPNMPWDGCELWLATVSVGGSLIDARRVAGAKHESIFQPEWSPDGTLYFVSDRTGWWNLYRWRDGHAEPVCPMPAEFGAPQWVLGMSWYAFNAPDRILCTYVEQGTSRLGIIDTRSGGLKRIDTPYTAVAEVRCAHGRAVLRASSPTEGPAIVALDLTTGEAEVLRRSSSLAIDDTYISEPEAIEFATEHGLTAHAFYYPPRNPDYVGMPGELPPLLVMSHGGPTGATNASLDLRKQFWTSRGVAVLDVNYGGSSSYGRAYRERINGQWGIVDVDDCTNAARYLVEQERVDPRRLAITGGSAGGYTTLCALTFRKLFRAGASYYGVGDLEALARDTHKFESHYLDTLIGPYQERIDLYRRRSPIHIPIVSPAP